MPADVSYNVDTAGVTPSTFEDVAAPGVPGGSSTDDAATESADQTNQADGEQAADEQAEGAEESATDSVRFPRPTELPPLAKPVCNDCTKTALGGLIYFQISLVIFLAFAILYCRCMICRQPNMERCPSWPRSTIGNRVCAKSVSGVRIPISPPEFSTPFLRTAFCFRHVTLVLVHLRLRRALCFT